MTLRERWEQATGKNVEYPQEQYRAMKELERASHNCMGELLAVVEAAEKYEERSLCCCADSDDHLNCPASELRAALAALREKEEGIC